MNNSKPDEKSSKSYLAGGEGVLRICPSRFRLSSLKGRTHFKNPTPISYKLMAKDGSGVFEEEKCSPGVLLSPFCIFCIVSEKRWK